MHQENFQTYRILKFVVGCLGLNCVLLKEEGTLRDLGGAAIVSFAGIPTPLGVSAYTTALRDAIDRTVSRTEQDSMSAFQSDFVVLMERLYIVFTAIFINYEVFLFVSFQQSRL